MAAVTRRRRNDHVPRGGAGRAGQRQCWSSSSRAPAAAQQLDRGPCSVEQAGYAAATLSWPDDPETIEEARAHPEVFARKTLGQVADHVAEVIQALTTKPVVMGH